MGLGAVFSLKDGNSGAETTYGSAPGRVSADYEFEIGVRLFQENQLPRSRSVSNAAESLLKRGT